MSGRGAMRGLICTIVANGPILGFDLACAWDLADGRMHHPALTVFMLVVFNFAAGIGWAWSATPSHGDGADGTAGEAR